MLFNKRQLPHVSAKVHSPMFHDRGQSYITVPRASLVCNKQHSGLPVSVAVVSASMEVDAGITTHELCISKTSVFTSECIPIDYDNDNNLSMDACLQEIF